MGIGDNMAKNDGEGRNRCSEKRPASVNLVTLAFHGDILLTNCSVLSKGIQVHDLDDAQCRCSIAMSS